MTTTMIMSVLLLLVAPSCTSSVQQESQPTHEDQRGAQNPASEDRPEPVREEPVQVNEQSDQLRWQLEVEPNPMTMAQRGDCRVRILVTNDGAEAVDPLLHLGQFTVNGQPSIGFSLAFQNGVMEPNWTSLPPGETAVTERALCKSLFNAPGEYALGFQYGSSDLTVRVRVSQ